MRHPESWYAALAASLNHPGCITLAEIRQAEARELRAAAATAKWRKLGDSYHLDLDGCYYVITREPGERTWQVQAWPEVTGQERYVRNQGGIRTLTDTKNLALAMPCFICGLANSLALMAPYPPAGASQADGPRGLWQCTDTAPCQAERGRLTGTGPARIEISQPVSLVLSNAVTGQSLPVTVQPDGTLAGSPPWTPDCSNRLADEMGP
jgi:hypothetical protein